MQTVLETSADELGHQDGVWPARKLKVLDWLAQSTRGERFIDNLLVDMCERLVAMGVPVARATLHFRVNHPQWMGARLLWRPGLAEADIDTYEYGIEKSPVFLTSPLKKVYDGLPEFRKSLASGETFDNPLFDELQAEGLTEYAAWPIDHTLGKRHVVTFSTDRDGGFEEWHLTVFRDILPVLALVTEIRLKNIMARTLLETYVGPHASEKILAGATTRGSGTTVQAAIMICDLRDFTHLSDMWPRDHVIELLNAYFDALSDPIEKHGGEILKFMGDGLLAIFPLSEPNACAGLLDAIREGQASMTALNVENAARGFPALRYGVGVHAGDVMYGNIGSRTRLDFTVIGPAVNIASRLETLTKDVGRPVLLSRTFTEMVGNDHAFEELGMFPLKGLDDPVDVFAMRD